MNLLPPPPASSGGAPPSDGEIDTLLSAFFRAEVPTPWPSLDAPVRHRVIPMTSSPPAARAPRLRAPVRSRMALAASVALLAAGTLFWSGRPDPAPTRPADPVDASPPSADVSQNPRADKPSRPGGKVRLLQKKDATYIEAVEDDGPPARDR